MYRLLVTTSTFIVASLLWLMPQALAHEYYLMPETFTPTAGTEFAVRHRLGQKFKGNELPWITSWNIRSEVWDGGEKREAKSKDGDRPALKITSGTTGLITVVHQSNVDILTFKTWGKIPELHKKRGAGIRPSCQRGRHQTEDWPERGLFPFYKNTAVGRWIRSGSRHPSWPEDRACGSRPSTHAQGFRANARAIAL